MNYIGSKAKLTDWIFGHIQRHMRDRGMTVAGSTFFDACTGSGAMSIRASKLGFDVVSTDLLSFPQHMVRGRVGFCPARTQEAVAHLDRMNNLAPVDGFFHQHYTEVGGRTYLTVENGGRVDAARLYIRQEVEGDPEMESYLLYCLLEGLSRVLNTTGVQAAFLKEISPSAAQTMTLRYEPTDPGSSVQTHCMDALDLLSDPEFRDAVKEDVLYVDPPYNSRQYGVYYHLYETLTRYDNPEIKGVAGLRPWTDTKSAFCSKGACQGFLSDLLAATRAGVVAVSYSSDGMVAAADLESAIMEGAGVDEIEIQVREHRRFRSQESPGEEGEPLREYLLIAHRAESVLDLFG